MLSIPIRAWMDIFISWTYVGGCTFFPKASEWMLFHSRLLSLTLLISS